MAQPKITSKVPLPKSSSIHDKIIPIPDYAMPSTKTAICKVVTLAGKYILLDPLLFQLVTASEKETMLLAIPEICANKIITIYHSSLFAGHQCVTKTYLTIGNTFFIPGLIHYL